MRAIQRLMGALCFSRRAAAGRPNPYADLMAEDLWGNLGASVQSSCWGWNFVQRTALRATATSLPSHLGWVCPCSSRCPAPVLHAAGAKRVHLSILSASLSLPPSLPPSSAARDFVRQCCVLLGQAQDSPLLVTVAAGAAALPTLLKLATVMGEQVRRGRGQCAADADSLVGGVQLQGQRHSPALRPELAGERLRCAG